MLAALEVARARGFGGCFSVVWSGFFALEVARNRIFGFLRESDLGIPASLPSILRKGPQIMRVGF